MVKLSFLCVEINFFKVGISLVLYLPFVICIIPPKAKACTLSAIILYFFLGCFKLAIVHRCLLAAGNWMACSFTPINNTF